MEAKKEKATALAIMRFKKNAAYFRKKNCLLQTTFTKHKRMDFRVIKHFA
jgi:hypothetical protein